MLGPVRVIRRGIDLITMTVCYSIDAQHILRTEVFSKLGGMDVGNHRTKNILATVTGRNIIWSRFKDAYSENPLERNGYTLDSPQLAAAGS